MRGVSAQGASLRVWLQSTCLLAVVAGYTVLLLINQRMADWQRLEGFRKASDQALSSLSRRAGGIRDLKRLLREESVTVLNLTLVLASTLEASGPRETEMDQGQQWLVQTVPLDLRDGSRVFVKIRQNVSLSLQQERLSFWLLVAAAGVSSLITSALLRPVLKQGLVDPLQMFGDQLQAIQMPPSPVDALRVEEQPKELQPIATAFNGMQQRLWNTWEQQRMFTDGMAHELRTPITLISGHAQSLLKHGAPAEMSPALELIRSEAERMSSLVSDLLDLARQDSQRLTLQRQAIQADDTLLRLYERMAFKVGSRLHLDPGSEQAAPTPIGQGDLHRVQQCLTALVDNALNYGPADGAITLSSSTGTDGTLILHVRDEGPGVPPQEREIIFERFVRGSAAAFGQIRGSGIGLAVVKLLMETMGGRVTVCDAPGGGADFQLHLPPFRASAHPPSA